MIQQYASNMVHVIPAATIEKLPDVNAAEAVRRVPGISLETDTGEGRFVYHRRRHGFGGELDYQPDHARSSANRLESRRRQSR